MLFLGWKHITVDALIFRSLQKINPPRASTRPGLPYIRRPTCLRAHECVRVRTSVRVCEGAHVRIMCVRERLQVCARMCA